MDAVEAQVLDLSGYCIAGMRERGLNVLTPQEPEHRGGVVAAKMDDAQDLWQFLLRPRASTPTITEAFSGSTLTSSTTAPTSTGS